MKMTGLVLDGLKRIELPIFGLEQNHPYRLKAVTGLGPPPVDVSISNTLVQGGLYQGRRPGLRQIVARVGFNPNRYSGETVEVLRTAFYGLLTPTYSDAVGIKIMEWDDILATATGWVSNIEINPFSKDPEIVVTLDCDSAYLVGPVNHEVGSGLSTFTPSVENVGTAPAGITFGAKFLKPATAFLMADLFNKRRFQVDFSFLKDDLLAVSTVPGYRQVYLQRNGVSYNLMSAVNDITTWMQLHGGTNIFYMAHPGFDAFQWTSFFYRPQFWGV